MTTAICIANGPSLTQEDVDFCRGKGKVYAVKEAAILAPWADVLYAADADWWMQYKGAFTGARWTVSDDQDAEKMALIKKHGLNWIKFMPSSPWSTDPTYLATGGNSGFQAVNLAVLQGASRVILLGYDMGHAAGGSKHWWTGQITREMRTSDYKHWIEKFNRAALLIPVPVLNATRGGHLECFARLPLEQAFIYGSQ